MKKAVLAAGISLLLSLSVSAAEPVTLIDKTDKLDQVIFGMVQEGSLEERIGAMDKTIYGTSGEKAGFDGRVSALYSYVVKGEDDAAPALATRVNTLEYYLTDEIKQASLAERIDNLEKAVFGEFKPGALDHRTDELEKAVYGEQHFELTEVELPANTVFKISLNEDINSKTNLEGDAIHFTVQEDVLADDVLVLPRGAQGTGVITKVDRPSSFGRSGKLEISFNQVFSIDDQEIPTVLGAEAQEKLKREAAAIGASALGALALGPVGLIGGFFVKGNDVNMPAGTELYIQTQEMVTTRGMKLEPGTPKPTARTARTEAKGASAADVQGEKKDVSAKEKTAADSSEKTSVSKEAADTVSVDEKAATSDEAAVSNEAEADGKEEPAEKVESKGKAEKADSQTDVPKDKKASESNTSADDSDEATVVIVRHE